MPVTTARRWGGASRPTARRLAAAALFLAVLIAAYSNHFHNSFHFDDFHTITDNPNIRDLRNVPRFFTDARTFSILPALQSYRPLTSASWTLDYWLAGGYVPFYFHLSTFIWVAVLLALTYLLFVRAMDAADPHPSNALTALLATACFGLHPVCAETVNYIMQRADLYSALGVVAGLAIWAWRPAWRKTGLYLLPPVLGALAKPPAVVFPLLLAAWVFLFEQDGRRVRGALRASLPAFIVLAGVAAWIEALTPRTFDRGAPSSYLYWITQPFVALHYFKSFFLPTGLTADTDRTPVAGILSDESIIGLAFAGLALHAMVRASRRRETRPIAYGIAWFFIAPAVTTLVPLAELDNDHRMFFPFVGLALAVVWSLRTFLFRRTVALTRNNLWRRTAIPVSVALLLVLAAGTYARNAVWHTEESLWRDVTLKSPRNGRGLMNYGLVLMRRGDYAGALGYFERAQLYVQSYPLLEVNLGIVLGELRRDAEAERHFLNAIQLAPDDARSYFYYARWLRSRGRTGESIARLETAVTRNQFDFESRYLLMEEYSDRGDRETLEALAAATLKLSPQDATARRFLNAPGPAARTPEDFLALSLAHYRTGRYRECLAAAQEALRLRPDYAEAYNNIAAGYNALSLWDEGIRAAEQAIRLKPGFELAINNLAYAQAQKKRIAHKP